jgi:hypothetical protein
MSGATTSYHGYCVELIYRTVIIQYTGDLS